MKYIPSSFFPFIKAAALGEAPPCLPPIEERGVALALAKRYDLLPLLAEGFLSAGLDESAPDYDAFLQEQLMGVFRYTRQNEAEERAEALFEEKRLPYMPLKGAVLRPLYVKPYLRTSCDTDYLLSSADCATAAEGLQVGGYLLLSKTKHDIGVGIRGQVTIELHGSLFEEGDYGFGAPSPFGDAEKEEGSCRLSMSSDYLLFYHIAHMAKHFRDGGCGLRPLLDLYLLEKHSPITEGSERLLREAGLFRFYAEMHALSLSYFEQAPLTERLSAVHEYLLTGGMYGERERRLAKAEAHAGGRMAYFLRRVFPAKEKMAERYPALSRRPYLYPYYWSRRTLAFLLGRQPKKQLTALPKERLEKENTLLRELGL